MLLLGVTLMHGGGFYGFGLFPVILIAIVLRRVVFRGYHSSRHSRHYRRSSRYVEDSRYSGEPERKAPKKVPEEMLKAAREVLDKLDWEIRLLERQRLDADSLEEREKIELDIKQKKDEYRAVVERLDL